MNFFKLQFQLLKNISTGKGSKECLCCEVLVDMSQTHFPSTLNSQSASMNHHHVDSKLLGIPHSSPSSMEATAAAPNSFSSTPVSTICAVLCTTMAIAAISIFQCAIHIAVGFSSHLSLSGNIRF